MLDGGGGCQDTVQVPSVPGQAAGQPDASGETRCHQDSSRIPRLQGPTASSAHEVQHTLVVAEVVVVVAVVVVGVVVSSITMPPAFSATNTRPYTVSYEHYCVLFRKDLLLYCSCSTCSSRFVVVVVVGHTKE